MISKLTFEKVMINGEKRLKFTGYENVHEYEELPIEYRSNYPFYYSSIDGKRITIGKGFFTSPLTIGDTYTPETIKDHIKTMKAAGERLGEINKRIKKDLEKWHGNTEIEI